MPFLDADKCHIRWYMVSCVTRQEFKLKSLFERKIKTPDKDAVKDIWQVEVPTSDDQPLVTGRVFVRGTESAIREFMELNYCGGHIIYDVSKHSPLVIPDDEMDVFLRLYEQYANELFVLEKPFDRFYSHIDKNTGKEVLNLCARVVDGPFAGRIGYIVKIKKNKCLAFKLGEDLCVSINNAWNYRLERIPDAHSDYMSTSSRLLYDADYLIDILQRAGFADNWMEPAQMVVDSLKEKLSFSTLCHSLPLQAAQSTDSASYLNLVNIIRELPLQGVDAITRLINYMLNTHQDVEYLSTYHLRPFLTPALEPQADEQDIRSRQFTPHIQEYLVPVSVAEERYHKELNDTQMENRHYTAHVYVQKDTSGLYLFANWHDFFAPYEQLDTNARLLQDYQIKNNCPELYDILQAEEKKTLSRTQMSVVKDGKIYKFNTLRKKVDTISDATLQDFVDQNLNICQAINKSTHLSLYRTRLYTLWLQK